MNLGKAIKQLRTELKLSQGDVCKKVGISQTSLSQIELGYKEPSKKNLEKICKTLNVPIALIYMLAIEGNDVPSHKLALYNQLFPTIRQLTLNILKNE
ncbi:MAG: helix-turn-helix transcriptional regulator [Saprospiraceae bacterium]|nr:helix-turn-helix transcriptional regulator [Candidatus Defluviibacterium haderslevense]